jgi:hypothetical protein
VALLVWLALDDNHVERRRKTINALLAQRRIGRLAAADRARLEKVLPWLAAAAGVRERVVLNQPFGRSRDLHVFTTTEEAARVTGCAARNAVYDAALDAVFIDREIIHSTAWEEALATPDELGGLDIPLGLDDVPSLRVYERFVILHELAHRQRHRTSGGFFDLPTLIDDPRARAREDEADRVALETIEVAYRNAARAGVTAIEPYTGQTINHEIDGRAPLVEQVQVSLVEMAKIVLFGAMFNRATRTPFAESASHASTFVRCERLVQQSLRRPMSADLRAMTEIVAGELQRMRERSAHIIAVGSGDAIVRHFFDRDRLVVCGARQRIGGVHPVFRCRSVGSDAIRDADAARVLTTAPAALTLPADTRQTIGSFDGGGPLYATRDDARTIVPLPGPSAWAVVAAGDGYESLHEGTVVARVGKDELARRVAAAMRAPQAGLDFAHVSLAGSVLHLPVGIAGAYTGRAAIDLRDFRVVSAAPLRLRADLARVTGSNPLLDPDHGGREMLCLPDGRCFIINLRRLPSRVTGLTGPGTELEVWELSATAPPVRRARGTLLAARLTPELAQRNFITPAIAAVQWVPPLGMVINVEQDSVYRFDARTSRLEIVFHPGIESARLAVSSGGDIAVSVPGSRRAFVIRRGE